ncbi:MAG: hypothetical protein RMX35_07395 [Nostoc sp. DcaGUA01]|nr:hypothetical protein [Nostoc sp. DcaGUA01]
MSSHLGIQAVRSLLTCQNKLKVKEKLIPLPLMSSPVNHLSLKSLLRPRVSVSVDKSSTGHGITLCPANTTKSDIKSRLPKRGF